jgi:hypothetical protein
LTEAQPDAATHTTAIDGTAVHETALAPINDPRFGYRAIRYSQSEGEKMVQEKRSGDFWSHARPNSILVCGMANHWKPGSWEKVMDMVQYTNDQGLYVAFEEVMDRCFNPYDSLGAMRNECIMKALQGYEYLLYVDNDVQPEKETLLRLVNRQLPLVSPMVFEPATGKPLHGPEQKPYTGLQPVRWNVLTMMLWHTGIFRSTGPEFWNDSIGADEGYHFQKLWGYGFRPYMDTDIVLKVFDNPTYPLATNRLTEEEAKSFWDKRREWLLEVPNRKPIDPSNPRVTDIGEYMPFLPAVPPKNGAASAPAPVSPTVDPSAFAALHEAEKDREKVEI